MSARTFSLGLHSCVDLFQIVATGKLPDGLIDNAPCLLHPIPPDLRDKAKAALAARDIFGFFITAPNDHSLHLLFFNERRFHELGIYEAALLYALTGCLINNSRWPMKELRGFLNRCDRELLRSAGDPLPGTGPFSIYRGVAGRGPSRRVRGISWTGDFEKAKLFAMRFPSLADPAVFRATVEERDVLAYINDRQEQEFIVLLPKACSPVQVWADETKQPSNANKERNEHRQTEG